MIVAMQDSASEDQIQQVIDQLVHFGFEVHRSTGARQTVLGGVGVPHDFDTREVRVAQAIIEHARTVYLVADHSKVGRPALVRQGHLSQVHALFTDQPLPEEMNEAVLAAGTQVHVAA